MINERFIQFVWQHGLFDKQSLVTVHQEPVHIKSGGFLNNYDGPDFSDARIFIGAIEWVGTVEIHVTDTDWIQHGHQHDLKYKNVILHVVWELQSQDAVPKDIPCVVLKDYVNSNLISSYQELLEASDKIPCAKYLEKVSVLDKIYTLEQASFSRIERKRNLLYQTLSKMNFDWRQMLFHLFAMALGKKANKEAMQLLSESLEVKILLKQADEDKSVEALLFGMAGFLNGDSEKVMELKKEFDFLKQKYELREMPAEIWNFSQVRGSSRPYISMAIFTAIVMQMSKNTNFSDIDESFLKELSLSDFWVDHVNFDTKTTKQNRITEELIQHLKINVLVPYLALLSKYYAEESYLFKAQGILESIKGEKNSIVKKMQTHGFEIENSFQTQGAIELHNEYCYKKRCVECHTGKNILGRIAK